MARALGGGSEPCPDCIDSPHVRSVRSRASPDDPVSIGALCLLGAISRVGLWPVRALIRSRRPNREQPCAIDFMRFRGLSSISDREKDFFRTETPLRLEMRPSGTPTGAANARMAQAEK